MARELEDVEMLAAAFRARQDIEVFPWLSAWQQAMKSIATPTVAATA